MNIYKKLKQLVISVLTIGTFGFLVGVPAYASTWSTGDVFVGVESGTYKVYDNTGVFKESINDGSVGTNFTTGCAFNSASDKLYTTNFSQSKVEVYDNAHPHTLSQTIDTTLKGGSLSESVVFASSGDFYVGHAGPNHQIQRYNAAGVFQQSYAAAIDKTGTDWLDLAKDQKTMFYTSEGSLVKRFDVSGVGSQLSDFNAVPLPGTKAFALRLLPPFDGTGGLLVADTQTIKRLDGTGAIVQTYDAPGEDGWFSLNLDPNGTSFWAGNSDTSNFYRFNIATGAVEVGPINTGTSSNTVFGICLKGELTAALQQITLTPATATNEVGSNHTVTAAVTTGGSPAPGVTVNFAVISGPNTGLTGTGVTDINGKASFTYTSATVGTDTIQACFTDTGGNKKCATATKDWISTKTTTTYTGQTTQDFNDPATLSAHLVDSSNNPISGATIDFSLSTQTCSGTTDASGNASCTITPNEAAGTYTVTANYAGDISHKPSSDSANFIVTLEETTTTYTGHINIAQGEPVSAVLKEDGLSPINGRTVTLSLTTGESCTGTTDASGNVSCTLSGYPLGPNKITASFAGDTFYKPSSDTKSVLIFATLSSGSFVLGDKTVSAASSTTDLTWWGAQWAKLNDLTGGSAPNAFKGFADTVNTPPTCGGTWTTDPGNSSKPPTSVPSFMAVIVADSIIKSGNTISGDIPKIVIVKTDPGYANNPGHAGTGTVVATLCGK